MFLAFKGAKPAQHVVFKRIYAYHKMLTGGPGNKDEAREEIMKAAYDAYASRAKNDNGLTPIEYATQLGTLGANKQAMESVCVELKKIFAEFEATLARTRADDASDVSPNASSSNVGADSIKKGPAKK